MYSYYVSNAEPMPIYSSSKSDYTPVSKVSIVLKPMMYLGQSVMGDTHGDTLYITPIKTELDY